MNIYTSSIFVSSKANYIYSLNELTAEIISLYEEKLDGCTEAEAKQLYKEATQKFEEECEKRIFINRKER